MEIDPKILDTNGPWLLWKEDPAQELVRSMDELGQLEPVLVERDGESLVLVAGYRRAMAAMELGIPLLAREVRADDRKKALMYLASNQGRTPTDCMRVAALRFFAKASEGDDKDEIWPLLGLEKKSSQARLLAKWLELPVEFDEHLNRERIPLAAAKPLCAMGPEGIGAVEPFFRSLSWSRSNAVNFLSWLHQAGAMTGKAVAEMVEEHALAEILEHGLSPKDAMAQLTATARELRYPTLTRMTGTFNHIADNLAASTPWRLVPAQNFETGAVALSVTVKDRKTLEKALATLENMAASGKWEELWKVGD